MFYANDAVAKARRARVFANKSFTLDGEPIEDFAAWLDDNGFLVPEVEEMTLLNPGQSMIVGGGAGAEFLLKRVG